ncbi:hypothetical protein GCM10022631_37500 [Deinococcus rubellus]|uniref:GNAT family N-acetyltransferase n=1 Tax=Deinococcus rubellus TaxID=1889240 RepID=A0ABY5YG00_9DEIO|nr:hypothetical protein [Deinococcus rubellus]UWX63219.1 hypothetical protein N0D28_10710 [Deinococcus rubellus]
MTSSLTWQVLHPQPLLTGELYDEVAAFLALAGDRPESAEHLRHFDEQRPAGQHHALTLARLGDQFVGLAETQVPRSHDRPGWYALNLSVHPDFQSSDLPAELLRRAESHLPSDRRVVLSNVMEGDWQESFLVSD